MADLTRLQKFYIAYYGRPADVAGLNYWAYTLDNVLGGNQLAMAQYFGNPLQSEFDALYGAATDPAPFINAVYGNLFNRTPDLAGLNYWIGVYNQKVAQGESPDQVRAQMVIWILDGATGTDLTTLNNKVTVANYMTAQMDTSAEIIAYAGDDVMADARDILATVTSSSSTVTSAQNAYVQLLIEITNTAPVANDLTTSTNEDVVKSGNLTATDANGDALTYTLAGAASHGTVVVNTNGSYTYTPNANYFGSDGFTFTVSDGKGGVDTGTVTITVNSVNDVPVAGAGAAAGLEDAAAITGSVLATDVDGDTLTYSLDAAPASQPTKGVVTVNPNGTFSYTPNPNANGTDTFKYKVVDGKGGEATATVTITITAVNDAPVANSGTNSTNEDVAVGGTVTASDVDTGDTKTFSLNTQAANGTVVVNTNGSYTYTPNANFHGEDSFTFKVTDSGGLTSTNTVSITVNSVNDAPVANDLAEGGYEDVAITGTVSASDVDGDTLTYSVATNASNGTVSINAATGAFTYTPNADFNGTDSFTYTVTDNGIPPKSDTATVTLTVLPVAEVLTAGQDTINGAADDETIYGANNNLNAGDSIDGGAGNDTLVLNLDGALMNTNFASFHLENVETFVVTNDSGSGVTFDMSDSSGVDTLRVENNVDDVTFNFVNGGANLEVINQTASANITVDFRNDAVAGGSDAMTITVTDSDDSFLDVGTITIDSGIEQIYFNTNGSDDSVTMWGLSTPGAWYLNIDTDVALDIWSPLSSSVWSIDGSSSTGSIEIETTNNNSGVSIQSGSGNDSFEAGTGNDTIYGNNGNDTIHAGNGNNSVYGGNGADWLTAGSGNDRMYGDAGNDTIVAGDGNNTVYGGANNDQITTGTGNDTVYGEADNDTINLGGGNDFIDAGSGDDTINAGTTLNASGGVGGQNYTINGVNAWWHPNSDTIIGGAGTDTLNISNDNSASDLNNVIQVENIVLDNAGGTYNYYINWWGGFGRDTTGVTINGEGLGSALTFNAQDISRAITVLGGSGNDTLTTGSGNDYVDGNAGNDVITTNNGNDTVEIGSGNDNVNLGNHDDTVIVENNELNASDTIAGGSGTDTIQMNARNVHFNATLGGGISGVERVVINDVDTTSANVYITFDAGYNQAALTIDGTALDSNESLIVYAQANAGGENLTILGGEAGDTIYMGTSLDASDSIDGNGGTDSLVTDGTVADVAFDNVFEVEYLYLTGGGPADNVTLAGHAEAAGIRVVFDSGDNDTINGSGYSSAANLSVYNIYGGNDVISTGAGNDTVYGLVGNDSISTGDGDDLILTWTLTDLDGLDSIAGGAGNDTIRINNGISGSESYTVNLSNVTSIENYTWAANSGWSSGQAETTTLAFTGGNVLTLNTINVNASNLTSEDNISIDLTGLTDADYAFNITGGAGNDTVSGSNAVNENLNFSGGGGSDRLNIQGGDLGSTVTMDGGSGNDIINITSGTVTDDSFVSVTSVEQLTASTAVLAQLGAKAQASNLMSVYGAGGNDNIVLDAAFTGVGGALYVSLSGGDDTVNAGASTVDMTVFANASQVTAADALTGGNNGGDVLQLQADNGTADLTNVRGFETITVVENGDANIGITMHNNNFTGVSGPITVNASGLNDPIGDPLPEGSFTLNAGGITAGALSVIGGTGDDTIVTGTQNDTVSAGNGNDSVVTGDGADSIDAGDGNNTVRAGTGNDVIVSAVSPAAGGNDDIYGGDGADVINAGGGNDQIAADDEGSAGYGNDIVDGGAGNDFIYGGGGADTLTGGTGADIFAYTRRSDSSGLIAGLDHITDFQSGTDKVDFRYVALDPAVIGLDGDLIDWAGNAVNFADAQAALLVGDNKVQVIFQQDENVLWVDLNDDGTLNANDLRIVLDGVTSLQASDVMHGSTMGTVVLNSGQTFTGSILNDYVVIADGATNVTVNSGGGNDTIVIGDGVGNVSVNAGDGDDTIISGNDSTDGGTVFTAGTTINGGTGTDHLYLDHNDNISAATVTGIEFAHIMNSTVTMTVVQHNGFTDIIDENVGTADTIILTGAGGTVVADADIETYVVNTSTATSVNGSSGAHTIIGSANNDTITGSSAGDSIDGGAGVDSIIGGAGNDTINAGDGNDIIVGADAGDMIDGGNNSDTLQVSASYAPAADGNLVNVETVTVTGNGAAVNVNLANQTENLTVNLSNLGDTVSTGTGADTVNGGSGNDSITTDGGNDSINAGAGNDTITAGTGTDTINAGDNDDLIIGADNADSIIGGNGTDTLQLSANYNPSTNNNLQTVENIVVSGNVAAVTVNMNGGGQTENLNVTLSNYGDTYLGSSGVDTVNGGTGNDQISGFDGADILNGNAGNDTLTGGNGNDTLTGGTGDDSMLGGADDDTFVVLDAGSANNDTIIGGTGNDTLQIAGGATTTLSNNANLAQVEFVVLTGAANVNLNGQTEAFTITGSSGNDTITAGDGADSINAGAGNDIVDAGAGNDTIVGADNNGTVNGGADIDTLIVSANYAPSLNSSLQNVEIVTISGNMAAVTVDLSNQTEPLTINLSSYGDTVMGGANSDVINGGSGNDVITGNGGADTMTGGSGNDTFLSVASNDSIDGGADIDTVTLLGGANYSPAADSDLVNVEIIDASAATSAVTIDLTTQDENITVLGSAYDDIITLSVGGADNSNRVTGGLGADTINLDVAWDITTLVYTSVDDSRGTSVDTINNFETGWDSIDLSAITGGMGTYMEEAVDNIAAQMALLGGGQISAVFSLSSQNLYVDVNGDGLLTNADMAINLVGVTDLGSGQIIF